MYLLWHMPYQGVVLCWKANQDNQDSREEIPVHLPHGAVPMDGAAQVDFCWPATTEVAALILYSQKGRNCYCKQTYCKDNKMTPKQWKNQLQQETPWSFTGGRRDWAHLR